MRQIFVLVLLWMGLSLFTFAKVSILMSQTVSYSFGKSQEFLNLFEPHIQNNESKIIDNFSHKKSNFALVRGDFLEEYAKVKNRRDYHIIGKLSNKMILYLFSKDHTIGAIKDLQEKKIAIGLLGDRTNIYLKNLLQSANIPYTANFISDDFYHALRSFIVFDIDAMFVLGPKSLNKKFENYIKPYPKDFLLSLQKENGMTCKNNSCYMSYYLIAADTVGKEVMHNIYVQLSSTFTNKKELTSNLGQYYIDIRQKKYPEIVKNKTKQKYVKSPKFNRTPWMDTAIKEAIIGKGSAENIFPMLDLSYKYIRFSKGVKGITTAPNDSKEGSWCAAYICWTLDKSGYKVHKKGRMASQSFRYFNKKLYRKIKEPIFGAITLYTKATNPLYGHVGYLFGRTKTGKNILLGGNQNNRLKFAAYHSRGFGGYKFNGFYIPIGYKIKSKDKLSGKDIYKSAKFLNKYYGIKKSKHTEKVR